MIQKRIYEHYVFRVINKKLQWKTRFSTAKGLENIKKLKFVKPNAFGSSEMQRKVDIIVTKNKQNIT
jgi:hypothetical protein